MSSRVFFTITQPGLRELPDIPRMQLLPKIVAELATLRRGVKAERFRFGTAVFVPEVESPALALWTKYFTSFRDRVFGESTQLALKRILFRARYERATRKGVTEEIEISLWRGDIVVAHDRAVACSEFTGGFEDFVEQMAKRGYFEEELANFLAPLA